MDPSFQSPRLNPDDTSGGFSGALRRDAVRARLLGAFESAVPPLLKAQVVVDVLYPRPGIEARIIFAPGEPGLTQKYLLLQSFGGAQLSTLELISIPGLRHPQLMDFFFEHSGEAEPRYAAGGRIGGDEERLRVFDESDNFGGRLAGYSANAVTAALLRKSAFFSGRRVNSKPQQAEEAEPFFDQWLELFQAALEQDPRHPMRFFMARAAALHRDLSSAPMELKSRVEACLLSQISAGL